MITLKNVNKYYNRHKKNEIHVINDTSLVLEDTGLVALLGPSGCGKTTLLNAIGGLDKVNSGQIFINGKKMPRIGSTKKDKMRVLNIGYIFQNYNLLDNLTVYENVALSLKMIGIKNRFAIKKRVDFILEAVGMYRYRNKPAGMLSGGQRQRVGIARALVKNPEVIIADEPTGNLDSKNTIEIMNIIKAISQEKLVILVTHEKDLAHFYASRIIEIEDGKITDDYVNEHENELDYRIDNKIYLKDFEHCNTLKGNEADINIYADKKEKLKLDIVVKNGNIYIKSLQNNKIEVVDEESGIEFVDDHYKKISKEDYENNKFDANMLDNSKNKLRYTSIFNFFSMLHTGFKKLASYTIMKKILLFGFFVSAMFIVYAVSSIFGVTTIKESNFLFTHRDYIKIENNKNVLEDYLNIENLASIDYVLPGDSNLTFTFRNEVLYQLSDKGLQLNLAAASTKILKPEEIKFGRLPENAREVVIDISIAESFLKEEIQFQMLGIKNPEDLIGKTLYKANPDGLSLTIVGLVDTNNPCIFLDESYLMELIASSKGDVYTSENNLQNYDFRDESFKLKRGRAPLNDYEVVIDYSLKDAYPLNKTIDKMVNNHKLKVVGYYSADSKMANKYYVSANTFKYDTIVESSGMMIYAKDKMSTIEELRSLGYNAQDNYQVLKDKYIRKLKDSIIQSLIVSGVLLTISFVEIFLMIRASFLSRIKEVGIYRAIGVKKADIYKMFLGEILVITTITGVTGILFMSSILNEVTKISFFQSMFVVDARVVLISIVLVYAFNAFVGLMPIRQTIKKTPAQILSRNDVD